VCEKEFIKLKDCLCNAPKLKNFNPKLQSILTTDASSKGLGAVLQQGLRSAENTIAFISRSLKDTETNYSVIEREALAVYWAIKKFKKFLWGRPFVVKTDHKPLVEVFKSKGVDAISSRITKWIIALQEYDILVEYVPGIDNYSADVLSRLVSPKMADFEDVEDFEQLDKVCTVDFEIITEEKWREDTKSDKVLQEISKLVCSGCMSKNQGSVECREFWNVRDQLSVDRDLLLRGMRLIPPSSVRGLLIGQAHDSHMGISKTKERLRSSYWWPGMDTQVERVVRDCMQCALNEKTMKSRVQPMIIRDKPKGPWEDISLDILGPIYGDGSIDYVIVVMDMYSRWPEVFFTKGIDTRTVIECLKPLFTREGIPSTLLTDNGVQLISREMEEFLKKCGIKHKLCALYHPECNGLVERFNRVLKETISLAKDNRLNWKQEVIKKVAVYRHTPHSTTGQIPFVLFRGRRGNTILEPHWVNEFLEEKGRKSFNKDWEFREQKKVSKSKSYFDRRNAVKKTFVNVGDWVLVKYPVLKTSSKKSYSPLKVVKLFTNAVKLSDGRIWNLNRISKF
ncbi:hypothetical protein NDU88_005471, partial [Pleurodeles waltl]